MEAELRNLSDDDVVARMHGAIYDGDADVVVTGTECLLERRWAPDLILDKALIAGLQPVSAEFREGTLFVPEVLLAAEALRAGVDLLRPHLAESGVPRIGKVVIGTVKGDIHDIGKNLVTMMLEGNGFEVIDLGIDIDVDKYLSALSEHKPDILGMSALLTTTMNYMKTVIIALESNGMREKCAVLVGGAPLNHAFAREIGADAYCADAVMAVEVAKDLVRHRRTSA